MSIAKFRCLSVNHRLTNGGQSTDTVVDLKPVVSKCEAYPGGSEENHAFWTATPVGEANIVYRAKPADVPFVVGGYYYVTLQLAEGVRHWKLYKLAQTDSQLDVQLGLAWNQTELISSASVTLGIQNKTAWAPFLDAGPGTRWEVVFSQADAPEINLATFP